QEGRRHGDRAVQQAARIVAQVEHEALQRALAEEPFEVLREVLRRRLLELRHPDPAVARLDELRLDALHPDYGAGDLDDHRRALALARDGERDARVWLAAHALDRVAEGHALHRRVVELDDQVAGLDAGAERRRVLDRDRKSTRLNSSHVKISYAVFCLKKKKS